MWIVAGVVRGYTCGLCSSLAVALLRSMSPRLLEGAGDAFAWGAAGRVVGVEAVGLVVVGVGGADLAAYPVAVDVVEPAAQAGELFAVDVVDAGSTVVWIGVCFYESGGAEDRQVLADEWLADVEGAGERGRGAGFVRERPHDLLSAPVGEQVECGQRRGCRPAVSADSLRVFSVMHLLFSVLPGSHGFMRASALSPGWRAGRICPVWVPCAASLRSEKAITGRENPVAVVYRRVPPLALLLLSGQPAGISVKGVPLAPGN